MPIPDVIVISFFYCIVSFVAYLHDKSQISNYLFHLSLVYFSQFFLQFIRIYLLYYHFAFWEEVFYNKKHISMQAESVSFRNLSFPDEHITFGHR